MERNYLQTPRFARELVRNSVSTRAGASLANALIRELVDCQMLDISPDVLSSSVMDKNMKKRQMANMSIDNLLLFHPLTQFYLYYF